MTMKIQSPGNIWIFWSLSLGIALGLKIYHQDVDTSGLTWILAPTQWLVSLLTAYDFIYQEGLGYRCYAVQIVIDKSCAGLTFLILSMCMLHFSFLSQFTSVRGQIVGFMLLGTTAYLATILINSFRIVNLLYIQDWLTLHSPWDAPLVHEMLGIFLYTFFLITLYLGVKYGIKNFKN